MNCTLKPEHIWLDYNCIFIFIIFSYSDWGTAVCQRSAVIFWPQLLSPTPPILDIWTWGGTCYRIQEWSCCVLIEFWTFLDFTCFLGLAQLGSQHTHSQTHTNTHTHTHTHTLRHTLRHTHTHWIVSWISHLGPHLSILHETGADLRAELVLRQDTSVIYETFLSDQSQCMNDVVVIKCGGWIRSSLTCYALKYSWFGGLAHWGQTWREETLARRYTFPRWRSASWQCRHIKGTPFTNAMFCKTEQAKIISHTLTVVKWCLVYRWLKSCREVFIISSSQNWPTLLSHNCSCQYDQTFLCVEAMAMLMLVTYVEWDKIVNFAV